MSSRQSLKLIVQEYFLQLLIKCFLGYVILILSLLSLVLEEWFVLKLLTVLFAYFVWNYKQVMKATKQMTR